ncbi:MAG: hypothetical protein Q7S06_02860 [Nanoarchaeota archaeon]|nr:hypothetical protein [Nanoarchaeota archaeon]
MKFDDMQARITLYGREILAVYGQINRQMLPSRNHVLVTRVTCEERRTSPFQRLDSLSLGEFMDKMYEFKGMIDGQTNDRGNSVHNKSEMEIKLNLVDATD